LASGVWIGFDWLRTGTGGGLADRPPCNSEATTADR
jgi:hypothetical protein